MSWTRRKLLYTSLAGATAAACGLRYEDDVPTPRPMAPRRPNLLFVFTDQERFFASWPDGMSLPGHDWLAERGTRFLRHYTSATMCGPSRSVMLTGRQTADTGMFDNTDNPFQGDLSTDIPTLGHRLRDHGYYTAYQGKWHLTGSFHPEEGPLEPGRFREAMEAYGFSDFASPGDVIGQQLGGYTYDQQVASDAVHWLRTKGAELAAAGAPWSLTVSLVNPHDVMYFDTDRPGEPVQNDGTLMMSPARAPDHELYRATWDLPLPDTLAQPLDAPGRPGAHAEYDRVWDHVLGHVPVEEWRYRALNDFYLNSIRSVDAQLVRIFAELDQLGLAENTVVVFTSDHGEMAGAHGLRGKGPFVYEEGIHLPLFVVHPDVQGGRDVSALTSHIDLVPFLLAQAGAAAELPGKDLSPLLTGGAASVRDAVLFTYGGLVCNDAGVFDLIAEAKRDDTPLVKALAGYQTDPGKRGNLRMVFDGRHKLARYFPPAQRNRPETLDDLYANNDVELYDLEADPTEVTNLAADRTHDDLVAEMNGKLTAIMDAEFGPDDGRELPKKLKAAGWAARKINL